MRVEREDAPARALPSAHVHAGCAATACRFRFFHERRPAWPGGSRHCRRRTASLVRVNVEGFGRPARPGAPGPSPTTSARSRRLPRPPASHPDHPPITSIPWCGTGSGRASCSTSTIRSSATRPPAKRRYGYFTLPILHRGRLIGRLDPKAHRAQGMFEVKALHLEPGVPGGGRTWRPICWGPCTGYAAWHGTPNLVVQQTEPPELAALLQVSERSGPALA